MVRRTIRKGQVHLIIGLADHFEPSFLPLLQTVKLDEQQRRVERWCREYPKAVQDLPDDDGYFFRHTYFYPAEQCEKSVLDCLTEYCHAGWGEVEIHLHHGLQTQDNPENTRHQIEQFRDVLVGYGCLSRWDGVGPARYAFVHGNFALANSCSGLWCGVDNEMQILSETGCYADFTLPAAPHPAQIAKINALYECALPLDQRAPHRRGRDLQRGRPPETFPLIIEGPLMLDFTKRKRGFPFPGIENAEVTSRHPPTLHRLRLWRKAAITVHGRPDWLFVKLHCHGMDFRDEDVMLGPAIRKFLQELIEASRAGNYHLHFVTAREMVNIALAACDGREGTPGDFRDYRLKPIRAGR